MKHIRIPRTTHLLSPRSSALLTSSTNPYLCASCLQTQTRNHHFQSLASRRHLTFKRRSTTKDFAHLMSRRLISLTGPDSAKYLQGLITNSITKDTKEGLYAAFLNARGRVLNDVFIYPMPAGTRAGDWTGTDVNGRARELDGDNWLIEVDAKQVHLLAMHLKKYKLKTRIEIRVLEEEEMRVISYMDAGESGVELGDEVVARVRDRRAEGMGERFLLWGKPDILFTLPAGCKMVGELDYKLWRYAHGVPEGQDEILREVALPQESGLDWMGGIDYKKGCYIGQELTIRTYHTGIVRKRIVGMKLRDLRIDETGERKEMEVLTSEQIKGMNLAKTIKEGGDIKVLWRNVEAEGALVGKWLTGYGDVGLGIARLQSFGNWERGVWRRSHDIFGVEGINGRFGLVGVLAFPRRK